MDVPPSHLKVRVFVPEEPFGAGSPGGRQARRMGSINAGKTNINLSVFFMEVPLLREWRGSGSRCDVLPTSIPRMVRVRG